MRDYALLKQTHEETIKQNIITRSQIETKITSNRENLQFIIELCRKDVVFFVNHFIVGFDPRNKEAPIQPLVLFPKQVEFLEWIHDLYLQEKWGQCVKSRDAGASVICCAYLVWHFIFSRAFSGLIGSQLERKVYRKDDPDCLFWKLQFQINHLPSYFKPKTKLTEMLLVNQQNGNTIKGDCGDDIGRGGRSSIAFLDEAAFLARYSMNLNALAGNTDCCVMVSTPNGMNGFGKDFIKSHRAKFKIHWTCDPRKSNEWYQKKCVDYDDPARIAQELDCDFNASVSGTLMSIRQLELCVNSHETIPEILTPNEQIIAGLDIAERGANETVLTIRQGNVIIDIISWNDCNTTQSAIKTIEFCSSYDVSELYLDSVGVGQGVLGVLEATPKLPFDFYGIRANSHPSLEYWENDGKTSRDKFRNLKAELWFKISERVRKTAETINNATEYHRYLPSEMISLPDNEKLLMQLSQPIMHKTSTGKLILESKQELKRRGISSPDYADSLILTEPHNPGLEWLNFI